MVKNGGICSSVTRQAPLFRCRLVPPTVGLSLISRQILPVLKENPMNLKQLFEFVSDKHTGQTDLAGMPYISHLVHVAETSGCTSLGLLHDILEATDTTADDLLTAGFEPELVAQVVTLTKKPDEMYENYIDRVIASQDPEVLRVKSADLRHNMDVSRLPALTNKHTERLRKYHAAYLKIQSALREVS